MDKKELLNPAALRTHQISNLMRMYHRLNRILTGEDVNVEATPNVHMTAPAWSDGQTVTFNTHRIGDVASYEGLVTLTGLNYHELAHIIYTPRRNSHFFKHIVKNQHLHSAMNILEDQRIETFMTATYPATKPYFISTFMKYCLGNESQWETNHLLAYGRRFLPIDIRREFAVRFKYQSERSRLEAIINEYRRLVYPSDTQRGLRLIEEFYEIMAGFNKSVRPTNSHDEHHSVNTKGTLSERDQSDARRWVEHNEGEDPQDDEEFEEAMSGASNEDTSEDFDGDSDGDSDGDFDEDSDEDFDEDSDGDSDGAGSGGVGEDTDEGADEGAGSGGAGDDSDDSDDFDDFDDFGDFDSTGGEGTADDASSGGNGSGVSGGNPSADDSTEDQMESMRKVIRETLDGVLTNNEVVQDITSKQASLRRGDGDFDSVLATRTFPYEPVTPEMRSVSKRFAAQLEKLRQDAEPGYVRHQSSGRININRAMRGDADLDTLWDRWDEGVHDATDIEVVMFVDTSGSMGFTTSADSTAIPIRQVSESMWIIKRALESVGAGVTVYGFDDNSYHVAGTKHAKENPAEYRVMKSTGSTNPTTAMNESLALFYASNRKHKVALFLTDGSWSSMPTRHEHETADDVIRRMNMSGVHTALAFYKNSDYFHDYDNDKLRRDYGHGVQTFGVIENGMDLVAFAKAITTGIIKRG